MGGAAAGAGRWPAAHSPVSVCLLVLVPRPKPPPLSLMLPPQHAMQQGTGTGAFMEGMDVDRKAAAAAGALGGATASMSTAGGDSPTRGGQPKPEVGATHSVPAVAPAHPHWLAATVSLIPLAAAHQP